MNRDTAPHVNPLTLDDHDPRVTAADAAEKLLYDFLRSNRACPKDLRKPTQTYKAAI